MATTQVAAGTGRPARPARAALAASRELLSPALRTAVDTLPPAIRHIAGYHFGWWDRDGRHHGQGTVAGKTLRPAFVLLAADAVHGDRDERDRPDASGALPAAVAVELVHNFSLLHDDVMDGDITRRHRPTAWSVFGSSAAILAGDALLTLAFDVLAGSGHPAAPDGIRMLTATVQRLVDGQTADIGFERRTDVGLPECLDMARAKTGALLGCACAAGALFGGAGPQRVERLRGFGERVGLAFQLVDDLLGIWGDPEVTGKPVHSDLGNRKKSLPVVAALTTGTAAGRELAAMYHREAPLSAAELVRAADLIDAAGARTWAGARVDDLLVQAGDQLRSAFPAEPAGTELAALARLVTRRDR